MAAGASRQDTRRLAVAASGGLDSTALLHCVASAAAQQGVEVHALHVNHGLHPQAAHWQRQVAEQCRRWSVRHGPVHFHARVLAGRPAAGDSIEAWARLERYAALAAMAREAGCRIVLLAHHRRDQAETLLLQALRGAGPAGLAAMPAAAERDGLTWLRPWLGAPREAIEHYARRWRLRWVDDPGNADRRFARNRLRHEVWPALRGAFPDAEATLGAAAARAAEARSILDDMAASDATRTLVGEQLDLGRWLGLGEARRANLLRHWAARVLTDPLPESAVRRLLAELPHARGNAAWPAGRGWLRLHAGRLSAEPEAAPEPWSRRLPIDLSRPGEHELPPPGGTLCVEPTTGPGVPAALLVHAELRPREGGEQFQAAPRAALRSLKKQFQSRGVPAWERGAPLLWSGDRLVFVPGLGMDARCLVDAGGLRCRLHWLSAPRQAAG